MYSVRFHLAKGCHYKHWQIKNLKDKDMAPEYLDPLYYQLMMVNCKLVNKTNKAQKVYEAGVKDVCGWIQCEDVFVTNLSDYDPEPIDDNPRLLYNPIVAPYWMMEGREYKSLDNTLYHELITYSNKVYVRARHFCFL